MIIDTTSDNLHQQPEQEFTENELSNRDLVIRMLKWESEYMCSEEGQQRYRTIGSGQFTSLDNEYAFNRRVLREFGFTTTDHSVANYRQIFRTYFRSPTDYDAEVIQASHYMRNNRCVFYTTPEIHPGDKIPDVPLLTSGAGQMPISLYDAIRDYKLPSTTQHDPTQQPKEWSRLFICAFSNS
jgi:hypothetical protein